MSFLIIFGHYNFLDNIVCMIKAIRVLYFFIDAMRRVKFSNLVTRKQNIPQCDDHLGLNKKINNSIKLIHLNKSKSKITE